MFTVGVAARVIYLAALRFLTEVEFQMGLLLVVTSGKGGAGKSTVSVGLASAFSKLNKSVLLIDFDEGLRCLDLMLNVSDKLIFDLSDVICRGKSTDEVALKIDNNIKLIAAPQKAGEVGRRELGEFLSTATDENDVVILDCPAGIEPELYKNLPRFSHVLVVASLDFIGCRSASALNELFIQNGLKHSGLIINKFDYFTLKNSLALSLDDIVNSAGLPLCGIVPLDTDLQSLTTKGKLYKKCRAAYAFSRIANRLQCGNSPLPKLNRI